MQRISRRRRSDNSNRRHDSNSNPKIILPYSNSLPERGYDWCRRCGIRSHEFQKKIGEHDPCQDLPQRIPFLRSGTCKGAQNYWRRHIQAMIFFTVGVFSIEALLPEDSSTKYHEE
jgi:hypothetical protein